MKYFKKALAICAAALVMSSLSAVPAFAADTLAAPAASVTASDSTGQTRITQVINSQHQTYIVDRNYDCWSSLYARGNYRYDSAVYVTADSTFPSYTVGIAPRMYNASNQIVSTGSTEFNYNTTSGRDHMAFTTTISYPYSSVQAGGDVTFYDGTGYIYRSVPRTSLTSYASLSQVQKTVSLTEGLSKDKQYPVNKKGETYGSELQAEIVGSKPDLIAAVGTKGESGYVRKSDINPAIKTPEEAAAYMEKVAASSHKIPLYNAEGEKIGEFQFGSGEQPAALDIQEEEQQNVKAQKEVAEIRLNGYPVNKKGETYGPELEGVDEKPDLIAVCINGQSGYIEKEEGPRTPKEAEEYMKNRPASRIIPIFNEEHEKIGEFESKSGPSLSQAEMQQRLAESRNAEAKK